MDPDTEIESNILMQFGRVENSMFNMDVAYPLSMYQAFSICLSSFSFWYDLMFVNA